MNNGDVSEECELSELRNSLSYHSTKSLLLLPIISVDGLHGFLFIHSNSPRRFPTGDIDIAKTIMNQANVAKQNGWLYEEARRFTIDL